MGRGYRNMFYATGQPGWMRMGYSPGWVGRSRSGMGPCAEYLMTGQWPAGVANFVGAPSQAGTGAELEMLKTQADQLEKTLNQLRERIAKLEE